MPIAQAPFDPWSSQVQSLLDAFPCKWAVPIPFIITIFRMDNVFPRFAILLKKIPAYFLLRQPDSFSINSWSPALHKFLERRFYPNTPCEPSFGLQYHISITSFNLTLHPFRDFHDLESKTELRLSWCWLKLLVRLMITTQLSNLIASLNFVQHKYPKDSFLILPWSPGTPGCLSGSFINGILNIMLNLLLIPFPCWRHKHFGVHIIHFLLLKFFCLKKALTCSNYIYLVLFEFNVGKQQWNHEYLVSSPNNLVNQLW